MLSRAGPQRKHIEPRAKDRGGERRRRGDAEEAQNAEEAHRAKSQGQKRRDEEKRRCRRSPERRVAQKSLLRSLKELSVSKPWAREVEEDNSGEMSLDHAPGSSV